MLTTALCFFYLSVRQQQLAKQPPPAAAKPAPNADPLLRAAGEPAPNQLKNDPNQPGAQEAGEENVSDGAPSENGADDAAGQAAMAAATEKPDYPAQTITLGDPQKGYKLQVTLTSRGAGVEHAELVERTEKGKLRYRALEHDGGYLGYLGLSETTNGLRIRTIPANSPASAVQGIEGGLQAGDVLVEVNGRSVITPAGVERILSETKPGQVVPIAIERGLEGQAKQLQGTVTLGEAPLDVLRMHAGNSEDVPGNLARPSLMTTLGSLGGTQIPVGLMSLPALQDSLQIDWATEPLDVEGGEGVQFRLPLDSFLAPTGRPAQLDLVKRYRLYPAGAERAGYVLDMETVIVNRNATDVSVSFRQEGPSGLTLEGWWYSVKISPNWFSGAGQRDVIYNTAAGKHGIASTRSVVDKARKSETDMLTKYGPSDRQTPVGMPTIFLSDSEPLETRSLDYIALDAPYFNAAMLPHPADEDALDNLRSAAAFAVSHSPEEIDKAQLQATNTSFWFDTQEQQLAAGAELSQRYEFFIGPKATDVLATYGLESAIEYGSIYYITKPLSAILHFFHYLVGYYGLAIIMLTVMVRGAMFPLGRKMALNAQRMQEMQPEMKRINEKYTDSMERAKATQELWGKNNYKPTAGCLPMFLQLPIFMGLYRCLSVDISLRQAPLIPGLNWAANLAGPDQLINWSSWMPEFISGRGTGWLGPYFNVLPMVTVGLFLLQQKMLMPKATDEQTRMTQNMMQVMTIFMGVLFFKVPAGLCIYFITSSIWSLVERQLVKRTLPTRVPGELNVATIDDNDKKKSTEPTRVAPKDRRKNQPTTTAKPPTRFEEMKRLLEKPAVRSTTQRGSRKDKKRR